MLSGLEVRLLHYFLLIIFAAAVIGLEFYFEMNQPELVATLCSGSADGTITVPPDVSNEPLLHLRNKIVLMFAVLTFVVAIVLMMFIKNITLPLQGMVIMAQKINEGDLDYTVEIDTSDEIGQLGMAMNELRNNVHEISAFTSTASQEIFAQLAEISTAGSGPASPDSEKIEKIQSQLQMLIAFVDSFKAHQPT